MMNQIIYEDMQYILGDTSIPWERLYGKTVLISGISGFLPAYMAEVLLYLNQHKAANISVIGFVRNLGKARTRFKDYLNDERFMLYQQDVNEIWHTNKPIHFIIHAASNASPLLYGKDPVGTLLPNVFGTKYLLDLGREKKVESFLYFSSGAIYGKLPSESYSVDETYPGMVGTLAPRACYDESKRMGETLCAAYHRQYEVPAKMVRIAHTYGPGVSLSDGRSFADFISDILAGQDIVLNSDGSASRPFLYLADAARAFFTVMLKGEAGEAYNVGYPQDITIRELAERLINMYPERHLKVRFAKESRAGYVPTKPDKRCLDVRKLMELGWSPRISVEEGFARTIASFQMKQ